MSLTDKELKALPIKTKKYRVSDGDGLSVIIKPSGGKYFIYRLYFNKLSREINLGAYPLVPLKSARLIRNHYRQVVNRGIGPIGESLYLIKQLVYSVFL